MKSFRNYLSLIVAAFISVATGCNADPSADSVTSQDLRILRAVVDIACKVDLDRVVISDRPVIPRESALHDTDHHNLHFGIDFDRRLAHEARWPRQQICPAVHIASDAAIRAALAHQTDFPRSWDYFQSKFGGAKTLMRISLPVYSDDGKHAAVYSAGTCPYHCGAGFYHELVKTPTGWKILRSINDWSA